MTAVQNYSNVFQKLCHLVPLHKEGKIEQVLEETIVVIMAIEDRDFDNLENLNDEIKNYLDVDIHTSQLKSAIERLERNNRVLRTSDRICLSPYESVQANKRIKANTEMEEEVKTKWLNEIEPIFSEKPQGWQESIWKCLVDYMAKAFYQHGIQTTEILNPSIILNGERDKTLKGFLAESHQTYCKKMQYEEIVKAIQSFFASSKVDSSEYIVKLLDSTFSYFALSYVDEVSTYLRTSLPTLKIFVDTNFIFGFFDMHSSDMNPISKELVEIIIKNKLPFKLYYHERTLEEIMQTIERYGARIKGREWTPSVSEAAVRQMHIYGHPLSGLERKYHELNAKNRTIPDIFLQKYDHVDKLLNDAGFTIFREKKSTIDLQDRVTGIENYKIFLEQKPNVKQKSYEVLDHDILLLETVQRNRVSGKGLNVGSFFLSADFALYWFDRQKNKTSVNTVILPHQLLQLIRPFINSNKRDNIHFASIFGVSELRTSNVDYTDTYRKVVSYLNTYENMDVQTASAILADEMTMSRLHGKDPKTEEYRVIWETSLADMNAKITQDLTKTQAKLDENTQTFAAHTILHQEELTRVNLEIERIKAANLQLHEIKATEEIEYRNRLASLQTERDIEKQKADSDYARLQAAVDRERKVTTTTICVISVVVGIFFIWILLPQMNWFNFSNHPRRLNLQFAATLLLSGLAYAYYDPKERRNTVIGVVMMILGVIAGIL